MGVSALGDMGSLLAQGVVVGISGRMYFAEWILEKEISRGAVSPRVEALFTTPHESDLSNGGEVRCRRELSWEELPIAWKEFTNMNTKEKEEDHGGGKKLKLLRLKWTIPT